MKVGSVICKSLSCSCTNSWSTRLVRPHPLGDLLGIARWDFCASTKAITFKWAIHCLVLMGEFPSYLHIMVGLFESLLEGHHIYCVACPGVHAHQLVGIME